VNQKYTFTLLRELDTVFFQVPPLVWSTFANGTTDSLVAVVDNIINGQVRLAANYDDLPFDTCRDYAQQCTTGIGCHLLIAPCDHQDRHMRSWIFGVEAIKFNDARAPMTFTFSVKVAPYQLLSLGAGVNATKTGNLDNGRDIPVT
jgi:hypothetical protein